MTTDDEVTRYHREKDVPAPLQKKLELLRHFTEYMDDFLTEGESNDIYFVYYDLLYAYSLHFFKWKNLFLRDSNILLSSKCKILQRGITICTKVIAARSKANDQNVNVILR